MKGTRKALAITSFSILALGAAHAQVAFQWMPPSNNQTVTVGTNITVALWAMPTGSPLSNISGFEAVVTWANSKLHYVSYTPFALPNNTFTNGTGIGDLSIFDFSPSFTVPAGGTHLGDITFSTITPGDTQVGMIGSGTIDSSGGSFGGQTIVYRLAQYGDNFTPDYSSIANIHILDVPEPATLALVGIGLAALALRRRAK